jgi:hypothetical protein
VAGSPFKVLPANKQRTEALNKGPALSPSYDKPKKMKKFYDSGEDFDLDCLDFNDSDGVDKMISKFENMIGDMKNESPFELEQKKL